MKYEVKPIEYSHEVELALKLHLDALRQDYERTIRLSASGELGSKTTYATETVQAQEEIKSRMLEVEEGLALFEKWKQEPVHYNIEDEIKDYKQPKFN